MCTKNKPYTLTKIDKSSISDNNKANVNKFLEIALLNDLLSFGVIDNELYNKAFQMIQKTK